MFSITLTRFLQAVMDNNVSLPRQVDAIMNPWVLQMGFPVVTIDTSTGKVSQKHFLLDPESNVTVQSPYRYLNHFAQFKNFSFTLFEVFCLLL